MKMKKSPLPTPCMSKTKKEKKTTLLYTSNRIVLKSKVQGVDCDRISDYGLSIATKNEQKLRSDF